MATMTAYKQGQLSWVDLMAKDMTAAKEFYCSLFGWDVADQDTQGGPPYAIFTLNGQQVCGMGEMNDEMKSSGMPPVWNSYIAVDDVQNVVEKAASLGANTVMPPMQVMDAGHMAIVSDPTGAFISFWQKINHGGAQIVNVPGTWCWNELVTEDPEVAQKFYGDLFGWTFEKEENSENDYWMHLVDGRNNGGMMRKPAEMAQIPNHWNTYFHVEDISASLEKLQSLGGQIFAPPFEVAVGSISVVADPQGGSFCLIHMSVPPDE